MKQKYKLETITPVHIGSGETLNHIDGYYANGRWYRIDLDKVLTDPSVSINTLTSEMGLNNFQWGRYLSDHNLKSVDFAAYSLPCQRNPKTTDIREAITTAENRPYIPGSTIKGTLRTVFLLNLVDVDDTLFHGSLKDLTNLVTQPLPDNPRNETPAKKIEQDAFGEDPNRDLLRALQVSDTEPITSNTLEIGTAWTVTLNQNNRLVQKIDDGREYKNYVQQIQKEQTLTFTLKVDELLFRNQEKKRLGFSSQQADRLNDIAEICRSETHAYMESEKEFYDRYNFVEIANRYDVLIDINKNNLSPGEFMLQIGWGTGYNANTVTAAFTETEESPKNLLLDLRKRYQLGRSRSQREEYYHREFPKTRRILYQGQNPVDPLGWVKISPI